ncbi:MAG: UDP-3-O-(3-hydroxymyristoyl)glucosamine N-acyltransferase [Francisellaceae bacterium]|nr:UDP-3-O-(3-hydroxymyristoyl)glucosamine N-acyltransferase [Francisellaceae bacterium]MBT6539538.1 UDP-3-O-(3-hydroxymyristoyl)glucosamine N-acyltransferase [Francisellaceae bacterium]
MVNFLRPYSLKELCDISGATSFKGSSDVVVEGINTLSEANTQELSFLAEDEHVNNFKSLQDVIATKASIVLINSAHDIAGIENNVISHENPRVGISNILSECCVNNSSLICPGEIDKTATVSANNVSISSGVSIGANVVIGAKCTIGPNVTIMANVVIDDNVTIGAGSLIYPNVSIYKGVYIGKECVIQSGAVIGSNGFGYARTETAKWQYIPQLAVVKLGDGVHIGANTCVDRGFIEDTVVGDGCIIDNQIQVGHNVKIGEDTAIAGCSAIAGSSKIGKRCMFGGGVGIAGHISICDDVMLTATTNVNRSITEPGVYSSGMHAKPRTLWQKSIARFYRLDDMAKKIRVLEKGYATILSLTKKEVEKNSA